MYDLLDVGGTSCTVVSLTMLTHVSSSPGLSLQYTSTGSFSASSLLICLRGITEGVLTLLTLMGVLMEDNGVLEGVGPAASLPGVLALLGFIFGSQFSIFNS